MMRTRGSAATPTCKLPTLGPLVGCACGPSPQLCKNELRVGARWRTAGERHAMAWQPVAKPGHAREQAHTPGLLPSSREAGAGLAPPQPGFPRWLQGCPHAVQILNNGPALCEPGSARKPHARGQHRGGGLGAGAPARRRGARRRARSVDEVQEVHARLHRLLDLLLLALGALRNPDLRLRHLRRAPKGSGAGLGAASRPLSGSLCTSRRFSCSLGACR